MGTKAPGSLERAPGWSGAGWCMTSGQVPAATSEPLALLAKLAAVFLPSRARGPGGTQSLVLCPVPQVWDPGPAYFPLLPREQLTTV